MRITTNNVPRPVIGAHELTSAERKQHDYLDWPAIDEGRDSASFFRYKGELHDLGCFMRGGPEGWDGSEADSFFSATLVRYVHGNPDYGDYEYVVVATYVS
jgi:hypothetical protein